MMFAALLITLPTRAYSTNRVGGKKLAEAEPAPIVIGDEKDDLVDEEDSGGPREGQNGRTEGSRPHQRELVGERRVPDL